MPSFHLVEVPAGASFDEITRQMLRAYSTPRDASIELCFPPEGTTKEAFGERVKDASRRIGSQHSEKPPTNRYVTVVDEDNHGAVVAGAKWQVYESNEENPHVKGPPWPPVIDMIDWWPEGSETRKFVAQMFQPGLDISRERLRRPHVFVSLLFTAPEYRRMGAATMLVDWGVAMADKLGLESYLYAEPKVAAHMYEKAGYIPLDITTLDMEIPNPSEEWKARQKQLGKHSWLNMWRPVGGKWEEGSKYPWEQEKDEKEKE